MAIRRGDTDESAKGAGGAFGPGGQTSPGGKSSSHKPWTDKKDGKKEKSWDIETSFKQTPPKRQYMSFLSVVSYFFLPLNKYVELILYA